jgi:hypothetical protein
MKSKILAILCFSILLLMMSACEGGTSGSVRNSSLTCRNLSGHGDCDGRIGRLSGTYSIDIEDDGISPSDQVWVELSVSVDAGSMRVFMEKPDGEETSVEIDPGGPANITGVTQGEFDGFEIGFQSLGEYAEGITYTLSYSTQ